MALLEFILGILLYPLKLLVCNILYCDALFTHPEIIRSGEDSQGLGSVRPILFTLGPHLHRTLWFRCTAVLVTCTLCGDVSESYEEIYICFLKRRNICFWDSLKGNQSEWHGYLQSLPTGTVDLPLFWDQVIDQNDSVDGLEALGWLRGTAVERILLAVQEDGSTSIVRYMYIAFRGGLEPMIMNLPLPGRNMHLLPPSSCTASPRSS